jgi:precorrin-6A/cobalt-precorrin-6A reductase
MTILILGGTTESAALADILTKRTNRRVISSLAGRTAEPRLPRGEVRSGGFGGAAGLAGYLERESISLVVDATHPFASRMGGNAARACAMKGIPLLRLDRPAWIKGPRDRWIEVDDWEEATIHIRRSARRVFLAVGRQELESFAGLDSLWFLLRFAEKAPPLPPPSDFTLIADRGPFTVAGECALLAQYRIDTIVCRNSGGDSAKAKLDAAAELGLSVIIRRRPTRPDLPRVGSAEEAADWIVSALSDR